MFWLFMPLSGNNVYLALDALGVLYRAVAQSEQRVVLATTYIVAWMEVGAVLTNENVARRYYFTSKLLAAQTLCVRVATVTCRT